MADYHKVWSSGAASITFEVTLTASGFVCNFCTLFLIDVVRGAVS